MATRTIILFGLFGFSLCQLIPDNIFIKSAVDLTFNTLDHSPQDGNITLQEINLNIDKEDVNKDGCVTESEFNRVNHVPLPNFAKKMFAYYDHDNDGCLTYEDDAKELKLMDASGDGVVTLDEFQPYVTHQITIVLHDIFTFGGVIGK